ncbi:type I 3-dehydroquinate dehydratase [Lactiplantibacillus daowaiensis]|uniref:3-dehydroquinate dehydratase n=1 Tax=Lactiplantibacillus daowaiensis TaxID=2559918 RepID=A0ABW1RZ16_9LACO|nr:type I 3-dehydroquinate dehydratase [Lactiplantibacillus daowaiensis]
MTQPVKVRNILLGSDRPKLAVPITGRTTTALLRQLKPIVAEKPDLVEWRIDYFADVTDREKLITAGQQIRQTLGDIALLTTFRTQGEGGALLLPDEAAYFEICRAVIAGHFTDALDVERYHDEAAVKQTVKAAHEQKVVIVMSNHDFQATPSAAEIVARLTSMAEFGADVPKIAVMPQSVEDVLTLLTATNQVHQTLDQPVITMSMGDLGKVSRVAGEVFGSCLSFATVGAGSAPGQIALDRLRPMLQALKLN